MESKQCFKCGEVKILTDYYLIKDKRKGVERRGGVCKVCLAHQASLIYAAKTPEQKKIQQEKKKLHDQKPESILRKKEASKNFRLRNLDAEREKSRVNYKNNRDAILANQRAYSSKTRNNLSLGYLKFLLGGSAGKKFPLELLEAKRVQIKINRVIRGMTANRPSHTESEPHALVTRQDRDC